MESRIPLMQLQVEFDKNAVGNPLEKRFNMLWN